MGKHLCEELPLTGPDDLCRSMRVGDDVLASAW